ncbi:MAG: FecR domain-containing protein [Thiolinea sp.]
MLNKYTYSLLLILLSSPYVLASTTKEPLGNTLLAQGSIQAERAGAQAALKRLSPVYRTDVIRSGKESTAQFRMIDDAYIDLYENSELRLHDYQFKADGKRSNVVMELISGGLRTISGAIGKQDKAAYQLKTPTATIGIRGTFYEVSLTKEGMYLAAWKGGITVKSYSGACNTAIGVGQKANFAFVDHNGQCKLLEEAPKVFTPKAPKAKTQGTALAMNSEALNNPVKITLKDDGLPPDDNDDGSSLARKAIVITPSNTNVSKGSASNDDQGTPTLKVNSEYLKTTANHVQQNTQPLSHFDVKWGRWADYQAVSGKEVPNEQGLMWISYQGTPKTILEQRSGSAHYDHMLASSAQSSMGAVSNLKVGLDVDFNSGKVTNGKISADVPDHTWQGNFDGQLSAGDLSLNFQGGQLTNHTNQQTSQVNGAISGDFVGDYGQGIVGGFNMADTNNSANNINGAFLIQQPDGN